MDERWFGSEFQIFGATDENDLEVAMEVLREAMVLNLWPAGQKWPAKP